MENKYKAIIAVLTALIAGLGISQLVDSPNSCSVEILKQDMTSQQIEIFELFETFEDDIDDKFIPVLLELQKKDKGLFNRVYHYIKNCKNSSIMMSTPMVIG